MSETQTRLALQNRCKPAGMVSVDTRGISAMLGKASELTSGPRLCGSENLPAWSSKILRDSGAVLSSY